MNDRVLDAGPGSQIDLGALDRMLEPSIPSGAGWTASAARWVQRFLDARGVLVLTTGFPYHGHEEGTPLVRSGGRVAFGAAMEPELQRRITEGRASGPIIELSSALRSGLRTSALDGMYFAARRPDASIAALFAIPRRGMPGDAFAARVGPAAESLRRAFASASREGAALARFRDRTEYAQDGIALLGFDGRTMYENRTLREMVGRDDLTEELPALVEKLRGVTPAVGGDGASSGGTLAARRLDTRNARYAVVLERNREDLRELGVGEVVIVTVLDSVLAGWDWSGGRW